MVQKNELQALSTTTQGENEMMLTVSQGDWNANLKKIASLTRENAQLRAAIEAQKETIATLNDACLVYSERCESQSALIEKLGEALIKQRGLSEMTCESVSRALDELAAWRAK